MKTYFVQYEESKLSMQIAKMVHLQLYIFNCMVLLRGGGVPKRYVFRYPCHLFQNIRWRFVKIKNSISASISISDIQNNIYNFFPYSVEKVGLYPC